MSGRLNVLSLLNELHPRRFGGDESRVLYFSKSLKKTSIDQILVIVKSPSKEAISNDDSIYRQFVESGIPVIPLNADSSGNGHMVGGNAELAVVGRTISGLRNLCRVIRKYHIDLIDVHLGGRAGFLGTAASLITHTPCVHTLYHTPVGTVNRFVTQFNYGLANALITDSEVRRDEVRRWLVRRSIEIAVIPSGVLPPEPVRPKMDVSKELRLDVDPKRTIVGQVARLVPFKGQMILLDAAQIVLRDFPDVQFLICGYPSSKSAGFQQEILQRSETLGIADSVRICGYPGRIGDVWQLIDIHVHASVFDSLPVAILEGMSLGIPAVVASTGGVPELVQDNMTGLVVPSGDARALAEGIKQMLKNPQKARMFGEAARERYDRVYSSRAQTVLLEKFFHRQGMSHKNSEEL